MLACVFFPLVVCYQTCRRREWPSSLTTTRSTKLRRRSAVELPSIRLTWSTPLISGIIAMLIVLATLITSRTWSQVSHHSSCCSCFHDSELSLSVHCLHAECAQVLYSLLLVLIGSQSSLAFLTPPVPRKPAWKLPVSKGYSDPSTPFVLVFPIMCDKSVAKNTPPVYLQQFVSVVSCISKCYLCIPSWQVLLIFLLWYSA